MIFIKYSIYTLLFLASSSVLANLSSFDATYQLFRGKSKIAITQFSLSKKDANWVWEMKTRPIGFYAWFTKDRPYSETQMINTDSGFKIASTQDGNSRKKPAKHKSSFNYTKKQIVYRKKKRNLIIPMQGEIYNYHTIHTLYSKMLKANLNSHSFRFYMKGKLQHSKVTLEKAQDLFFNKTHVLADKFTQTFEKSEKQMIYYYTNDSLVPQQIMQMEPGSDSIVMWNITKK